MSDLQAAIRRELRNHLNIILFGKAGAPESGDEPTERIDNLYTSMGSIEKRPVVHPYGLVSRAPEGTDSCVAQVGDHPGSKFVIGHRDKNRPTVTGGEVMLYDAYENQIYLKEGQIILTTQKSQIGSDAADEPLMLGNVTKGVLSDFMQSFVDIAAQLKSISDDLATHMHPTAGLGPPSPPVTAAVYVAASAQVQVISQSVSQSKTQQVDSGEILSDAHFTEKGQA